MPPYIRRGIPNGGAQLQHDQARVQRDSVPHLSASGIHGAGLKTFPDLLLDPPAGHLGDVRSSGLLAEEAQRDDAVPVVRYARRLAGVVLLLTVIEICTELKSFIVIQFVIEIIVTLTFIQELVGTVTEIRE